MFPFDVENNTIVAKIGAARADRFSYSELRSERNGDLWH
jgi:hypothetical protein